MYYFRRKSIQVQAKKQILPALLIFIVTPLISGVSLMEEKSPHNDHLPFDILVTCQE